MDVRVPPAVMAAVDQALTEFGKIDILINCESGLARPESSEKLEVLSGSSRTLSKGSSVTEPRCLSWLTLARGQTQAKASFLAQLCQRHHLEHRCYWMIGTLS